MKKILILAYDFPPYVSVAGMRPYSWLNYFHESGLYPVVVTRQWANKYGNDLDFVAPGHTDETIVEESTTGTIIRTPYKPNLSNRLLLKYGHNRCRLIRKCITGWFELWQWFFFVGSKSGLYYGAKEFLKTNKVDAIIATGCPFVLYRYASVLSKRHKVPWIADYRDDWIYNHGKKIDNKLKLFIQNIEKKIENKYLRTVAGITSVSDYLTDSIAKRLMCPHFETIENGASLETYEPKFNPFLPGDFVILYSGVLYDLPYLKVFFEGVKLFLNKTENPEKIKIYFIGVEKKHNQALQDVFDFKKLFPENIYIEPSMSQEKVSQYQLHAAILLNLIAGDPELGLVGAKSYSYAVTGNPILTIPHVPNKNSPFFPGRDIQFIATSHEEVEFFLIEKYKYFKENTPFKTSITENEKYMISRKFNSKKMGNFINKFI